jgi:thiamine biosynthesis lipoprotein
MKKLILVFFILFLIGCTKNEEYYSHNMFYMDTYINIKIYDIKESGVDILFDEIDNIYENYNNLSDRYNEYDNLINIYYLNNILDINESIEIDSKLYNLISYAKEYYYETDGLVNIALGNVVDIWKKYRDNESGIPSIEELNNSGSINIEDIVLESGKYLKTSDVSIDLGSIAKGYATQEVGEYLESIGYSKYLINAGGNVKVGNHYDNDEYKIGLEDPSDTSKLYKVLTGNNISVITSGAYQRYYEYEGIKYSHIIDPNTLFPPTNTNSVTVIINDSAYGDIMSTYLFLIPISEGIEYVDNHEDIEALWYDLDGEIHYSKGLKDYEQE